MTPSLELSPSRLAARPREIRTHAGPFRAYRVQLPHGGPALALARGDTGGDAPLRVRVHSSCVTSEALGGRDCDCADQLAAALAAIAADGRGVLLHLPQEGRGAGLAAKARDRMLVQASDDRLTTFEAFARMGLPADARRYDAVPALLAALGVRAPLRLLTHNPEKATALEEAGVAIAAREPLPYRPSAFSWHYLEAKSRSGHALAGPGGGGPAPATPPRPEPVKPVAARPLSGAAGLTHVACYWLPVPLRDEEPARWIRTHAVVEETGRSGPVARLVLEVGAPGRAGARRVLRDRLEDRVPRVPGAAPTARRVAAVLRGFVRAGAGRLLVLAPDERAPAPATREALLHAPLPPP